MDHSFFMRQAIARAYEGLANRQSPFGACLVRDAHVVASAHNQVEALPDVTAHAELCALRAACQKMHTPDLSGCVIYTTCEPCPMCFSACHFAKVATIVFACRIEDAMQAKIPQLVISVGMMQQLGRSEVTLVGDVLRNEALEVFRAWQQAKPASGG
jgi:guanine deaminase